MIDQTSLGHRFLAAEFGVAPKVTWQIDPFGHTVTQAALLSSAWSGFQAIFFGRAGMLFSGRVSTLARDWQGLEIPSPAHPDRCCRLPGHRPAPRRGCHGDGVDRFA